MLVGVEPVQWVRRQRVFREPAVAPHVDDRRHRAVGGVLDGDGDRVAAAAVDVVGERDDPAVAVAAVGLDDAREVALLDPQFRRARELAEQERRDLLARELPRSRTIPKCFSRDVLREDARVVPVPVHRAGADVAPCLRRPADAPITLPAK